MVFLVLGIILLAMKATAFGPVAEWSWLIVLAPFGLAVLWWAFADSSGLTQKRAIAKMEQRKADRRQRDMDALGLGVRPGRGSSSANRRPAPPSRHDPALPTGDSRHDIRAAEDSRREPRL